MSEAHVKRLIEKSANAIEAVDAGHYARAALDAANAVSTLAYAEIQKASNPTTSSPASSDAAA